jgi:hypothetical protein
LNKIKDTNSVNDLVIFLIFLILHTAGFAFDEAELMQNKDHRTQEGLEKIRSIKAVMNKGRK